MRNIEPDSEENQLMQRDNERYIGGLKLQADAETTAYFTFGQNQMHSVNGITFDKDCVVKITAKDPRKVMFDTFGRQWSMQYEEPPCMALFPRGMFEL